MASLRRQKPTFCCTGTEPCCDTCWDVSCPSALLLTSPLQCESLAAALQQEGNERSRRAPTSSPHFISCECCLLCCNSIERNLVIKLLTTMNCRAKNKAGTIFFSFHQSMQALPPNVGCLIFPASLGWRMSFQRLV